MDRQEIQDFLDAHAEKYDIRETGNGRWIDQKCTMDVVCLVADCIVEYNRNYPGIPFTVKDIWWNEYTVENVRDIFSKPDPTKKASNEYDKYFGQPIKLLDAAGILKGKKKGRGYEYSIREPELLEYISFKERNCLQFLCLYIERVLKESGLFPAFEQFFDRQDKDSFQQMKEAYVRFMIEHTRINTEVECGRIFTKVLNPLAWKYKKKGTERGRISRNVITQDMLLYNQRNWRDILSDKPKELTRGEYEPTLPEMDEGRMSAYRINRAKKYLKRFNNRYRDGVTELLQERHTHDPATQIHHIFPASEFPEIADDLENLIALTPTQHFSYAHPNNDTRYVDPDYQYQCLRAKALWIRANLNQKGTKVPVIYEFSLFQKVLDTGLHTDEFSRLETGDFDGILRLLDAFYGKSGGQRP